MKERNLHTILDGFQKMELQDLGNILGNDLSPRLRKSQLVDQLHTYLRAEPRRWMSHLMERDVRLLRELVHAGPEKVQYQDFADYPSLLEVTGLVEYDDSDEHYHKVWISRELYEIVAPEVEKVIGSGEKSGQFEVERIGHRPFREPDDGLVRTGTRGRFPPPVQYVAPEPAGQDVPL